MEMFRLVVMLLLVVQSPNELETRSYGNLATVALTNEIAISLQLDWGLDLLETKYYWRS